MTTVMLLDDIEKSLTEGARKRGTTPELPAVELLRQRVAPSPPESRASGSMLDFLEGFVGTIEGTSEAFSEDCGRRFSDALIEQQRQERR